MAKKIVASIMIDPEVKFYAEQVAVAEKRSFSNLIGYLLTTEIELRKKNGFIFSRMNDASTEYVGSGTDEKLVKEFDKFIDRGNLQPQR
ncbi:MAG: hypothetical protein BWX87_00694 [Bacteroidetes bacterium ADurb.Bin123]|jgi:hypothetical protein|nr:MAG: hypothetical protein BWX87_00694 [Bacteroidetes bacterium ADurb.Bin123]